MFEIYSLVVKRKKMTFVFPVMFCLLFSFAMAVRNALLLKLENKEISIINFDFNFIFIGKIIN